MLRRSLIGLVVLSASAVGVAEESCTDVVADTVAEMRVGVGANWNDDMERLARAAAGAACVKAMSGRYDAMMAKDEAVQGAAVAGKSAANTSDTQSDEDKAQDEDSWSFGGLTFKSMSGSPGKKPYERQRQQPKEDADAADSEDTQP